VKSNFLRWLGIILILETGLLHILTSQAEYEEAAYMGYLFAANFFGALVAAFGIYHKQVWGWILGLVVAVGSIAGYIWSRTLGMPQMNVEEWFSPYGVIALTVEGAFVLLALLRPWKVQSTAQDSSERSLFRYAVPLTSLLLIAAIGLSTQRWDASFKLAYGHHVGTLDQVCSTPPTTIAELEENYGVQVSLVATSMLGSIVDVRIKVVDSGKAQALLQNQAALLVNQEALILAPHMHSHVSPRLKAGKIFMLFFPTQRIITAGSQVSLVFGSVRVEPVTVQ
jgi:hypothetical protein